MTRDQEIEYNRRRSSEELLMSKTAALVTVEALHIELVALHEAKAEAVEADPDWRPSSAKD